MEKEPTEVNGPSSELLGLIGLNLPVSDLCILTSRIYSLTLIIVALRDYRTRSPLYRTIEYFIRMSAARSLKFAVLGTGRMVRPPTSPT